MRREYVALELPPDAEGGFALRGAALELWRHKGHEAILAGPAETGKTFACLHKLDGLLWKYPGAQAVMLRKVRDTIYSSCLQTYLRKVIAPDAGIKAYGANNPQWFDYPNGSRLWVAGLDDPGKALSSERDFVYVNQAEEVTLAAWQVLCTRATGRAGNAPYAQVFGDCNPGPPHHWILARSKDGPLKLLHSRHEDNPALYDDAGQITVQGRRTMAVLNALTGLEYDRLAKGRWVQAEGVIYKDWNRGVHLIEPFAIPHNWPRFWAVDFGYTNPFACLMCAMDGDGRLYVYRQIYHTKRRVDEHAERMRRVSSGEPRPYDIVADSADREGRETLAAEGFGTIGAVKSGDSVRMGIQAVQKRLAPAGDGRPRLFVFEGSLDECDGEMAAAGRPTCLEEEMESYKWQGKGKDEPAANQDDHAADAIRYLIHALDAPRDDREDDGVTVCVT